MLPIPAARPALPHPPSMDEIELSVGCGGKVPIIQQVLHDKGAALAFLMQLHNGSRGISLQ